MALNNWSLEKARRIFYVCSEVRDFGKAVESLFRRTYPENMDVVRENVLKAFLENCTETADFRMTVKRTKPQTLQEAVKNAIQVECIWLEESERRQTTKPTNPCLI